MEAEQLKAFLDDMRREIAKRASVEDTARAVRRLLKAQLATTAFPLDCIGTALDKMGAAGDTPWTNPPLFEDYESAFQIRVFFWPPGFANQAHRHDEWTVTGVLHNALTFLTYLETPDGLLVERRIEAKVGDVGYISSPCTHNVSNDTDQISVSLHVFSGVHQASPEGAHWDHDPQVRAGRRAERVRALRAFVDIARRSDDPRRLSLLDRLFALGDPSVKLVAAKAMAPIKPELAALRLGELARLCSPSVAEELHRLAQRLGGLAESPRATD